jgi:hypothetical protein
MSYKEVEVEEIATEELDDFTAVCRVEVVGSRSESSQDKSHVVRISFRADGRTQAELMLKGHELDDEVLEAFHEQHPQIEAHSSDLKVIKRTLLED